MPVREEAARALSEAGRIREVVDGLRDLLAAALAAERRAGETPDPDAAPSQAAG
jgi:hypothetical protein